MELLVRADEKPSCTACGSKKVEKLLSHFAPMRGGSPSAAEPMGCGVPQCCRMQGGGCAN